MSLRSEYSYAYVFNPKEGEYEVTIFHHANRVSKEGFTTVKARDEVDAAAERLISAHMELVTRMLEGGPIAPDKAEEHDRRAHKADHDNQIEKDLQ